MTDAMINEKVLAWAVDRAEIPLDVVAKKINVKPERLATWIGGNERPTFRQAQSLSSVLHIPFGYLFLNEPPEEKLAIPDLRTVGGDPARRLDLNFRDLLSDVLFKRDWFRDFIQDHAGHELNFVGKYNAGDSARVIADDMRLTLHGEKGPPKTGSWEEHLRMLIDRAEAAGIWVMRNGIVGSNTHRPLSVSQFRGFAIADKVVPLIFINGKDAKAAQIFTFAHELAHLWLGESGVSNVQLGEADYGVHQKIERKCNEIAAEFLIPAAGFPSQWRGSDTLSDNADRLSRIYKVSRIVIVRRALDLGLIDQASYSRFYATEAARWSDAPTSEGGSFHNNLPLRNGQRFTRAVVNQAVSGGMLLRHAASLLNAQPTAILSYHKQDRPAQ
ncbi:DNA-binding protein [Rhizobium leguminosarum bv. trifolii]|uniref:DNA-binding protein n=1 Tax=Rhizobium leguminosarum bv. trifolii TaxID=386 RepID=A0A3E1AZ53_RHILT|nr:ImmA/IrrE family metallo-endopeptidase [Rhizobium leguminosarum]RFB82419.1 DNA-binding protein [Rhizobium leguminosarum bv. trifolii]RFB82922.1 DNA-binding protein [Rhizobium leguminosarum bv. trifolii]